MKTRSLLTLLLVGCLTATARCDDQQGFLPIFNGKDLTGWDAKPACWEVRDGEIWCTGKSQEKNWLIYRKEQPTNFILRLEFRWDKGNSGVQVRSDDVGDWQIHGYQVEVATQEKMGLWHHSLLDANHPKKKTRHLMATAGQRVMFATNGEKTMTQVEDADKIKAHFRDHEWNTMEIIARGDTLVQKINDIIFSTLTDRDTEMSRKRGFVALQDHGKGCIVAFRNIKLKNLSNGLSTNSMNFKATHIVTAEEAYYLTGPQQSRASDGKFKRGTLVELISELGSYSVVVNDKGMHSHLSTMALKPIPEGKADSSPDRSSSPEYAHPKTKENK